jgi:hypothetical protein
MIHRAHCSPCILSWPASAVLSDLQKSPDYSKGLVARQTTPTEAVVPANILGFNTSIFDLFVAIREGKPVNARP